MYRAVSLHRVLAVGFLTSGQCRKWPPSWSGCALLTATTAEAQENQQTANNLHSLLVDVTRVRQLKSWVLLADKAYVIETADILKVMGAEGKTVARILQRYPEAVLCPPSETRAQWALWASLCPDKEELLRMVEQCPESFFITKNSKNWQDNVKYLEQLNLNKKIIRRLLATCPQIFCNDVGRNRAMVEALQKAFLQLGGTQANMNIWLVKLLSQNPLALLKPPGKLVENLTCLQTMGFSPVECLQLITKLKGLILELSPHGMEACAGFCQQELRCSSEELWSLVLRCPGLLYLSVGVLQERLQAILRDGFSVEQVKESPAILEVSTHILQYRLQKLRVLGNSKERGSLDLLGATRKDFEASYGKMAQREERPLFNPVAPLDVED